MKRKLLTTVPILAAILFFLPATLQADTLSFSLNFEFSGATPPSGPAPWITFSFNDNNTPGSVDLTISTSGLIGTEYVSEIVLNLNPALDLGSLVITPDSIGTPSTGTDAFRPDGDGFFDIQIVFPNPQASRFGAGQSVSFTFSGIASLTVHDFNFLSAPPPGGGPGPFLVAAHVQGIGPGGSESGWVTQSVPEPSSLILLAAGLLGLGFSRRKLGTPE